MAKEMSDEEFAAEKARQDAIAEQQRKRDLFYIKRLSRVDQDALDLERKAEVAELEAERQSVLASRAVAAAIEDHRRAEERAQKIRADRRALIERYGGGWQAEADLEQNTIKGEATRRQKRAAYTDVLYAPVPQVASPRVVLGGPVLHARDPHHWNVEIYTSAEIGDAFAGFELPVFASIRDRMKKDLAERTGVDESEIEESAVCMNNLRAKQDIIASEEAIFGMMIQLRAIVTTQQGLTAMIQAPELTEVTVRWAGALQHIEAEDESRYQLSMLPHTVLESTTSGGTGRRLIIPHDGRAPYITSNSADSVTSAWIDTTNLLDAYDPRLIRPDDRVYTKPPDPALFDIMLISSRMPDGKASWSGHFVRLS